MKRLQIASMTAALLLAGPALAGHGHGQGNEQHGHGDRDHGRVVQMGDRDDDHHHHHDRDRDDRRHDWKAEGRHDNGRHVGQYRHWARGQRLPGAYLAPRYYVRDYRVYRLAPPPRGMVWVRPYQGDPNFYLVQAATGLISQILGR
ncbi:RcnB family protein [Cognatilysobacter lacus]|uniref:RcnB family protein n=1 Tax=Cognatilysobacter lacus TaxID=1643323 RepID=A0A5D8YXW1_9GAMM|nr:RcnB family protein [Lysobacter lacus]TZF86693.1 hypothetical protein FW784_12030 [Lysobacter lacus]